MCNGTTLYVHEFFFHAFQKIWYFLEFHVRHKFHIDIFGFLIFISSHFRIVFLLDISLLITFEWLLFFMNMSIYLPPFESSCSHKCHVNASFLHELIQHVYSFHHKFHMNIFGFPIFISSHFRIVFSLEIL